MTYRPAFLTENLETPGEPLNGLSPRYTLENYVLASDNAVAAETARQVSQNLGRSYNPLLIVGGNGLGKTHLLNAIGQAALSHNPAARVRYTTSEGFVRDLIHGIREQRIEDFRHYYRNLDLWLVDDIDFIAGKDQTQEEFLHTFDDLLHHQRQIVVASRRFPQELPNLSGNLRSRLVGGVVTLLQPPGLEARLAFLEAKVKDKPVKLDSEILRQLAETITGNYSELEGALNSLLAYARNAKLDLTGETAGKVLQDLKFRAEQHSLI